MNGYPLSGHRLAPKAEPMNSYVKKWSTERLRDMMHGVYRVGVSSAENDQQPYVLMGP